MDLTFQRAGRINWETGARPGKTAGYREQAEAVKPGGWHRELTKGVSRKAKMGMTLGRGHRRLLAHGKRLTS